MWQENEYNTTLMEILPFIQDDALEFGKTTVIPSERRDLLNVAGKRVQHHFNGDPSFHSG
ncbi:hypothetical protein IZU94_04925 [Legionella sp. 27fs60]|uniref:Uncharacterized protein n=1 Tax=Legionella bononiensis TaxID=2793102 RepID=A0ABS1WF35_9GAMM|nr:hypothetical protein [Legionella bononiensis]MBL7527968.1 hypothetical protein [Legionella bononiensis]MBL7563955.1 hypothetical protein [Legionella bononiensis]